MVFDPSQPFEIVDDGGGAAVLDKVPVFDPSLPYDMVVNTGPRSPAERLGALPELPDRATEQAVENGPVPSRLPSPPEDGADVMDITWDREKGSPVEVVDGQVLFDPARFDEGVELALQNEIIDEAQYKELQPAVESFREEKAKEAELIRRAGENPEFASFVQGFGRGSAVTAGAIGGAKVAGALGALTGPAAPIAVPVGAALGAIGGGIAANKGYNAAYEKLGELFPDYESALAAKDLKPGYNMAGELVAVGLSLPVSAVQAGRGLKTAYDVGGAAGAAKMAGTAGGAGAATGVVGYGINETVEGRPLTASGAAGAAGAGMFFGGFFINNRRVTDKELFLMAMKTRAGGKLSPAEQEIMAAAKGPMQRAFAGVESARGKFPGTNKPGAKIEVEMDQASVAGFQRVTGPARVRTTYEVDPRLGGPGQPAGAPVPPAATGPQPAAATPVQPNQPSPTGREFLRRAGVGRNIVPAGRRDVMPFVPPVAMGPGAGPEFTGQNFQMQQGGDPVFQGGRELPAGRQPAALPEVDKHRLFNDSLRQDRKEQREVWSKSPIAEQPLNFWMANEVNKRGIGINELSHKEIQEYKKQHDNAIEAAIKLRKPFKEKMGMEIPKGYVKQGELYVFQPVAEVPKVDPIEHNVFSFWRERYGDNDLLALASKIKEYQPIIRELKKKGLVTKDGKFAEGKIIFKDAATGEIRRDSAAFDTFEFNVTMKGAWRLEDAVRNFVDSAKEPAKPLPEPKFDPAKPFEVVQGAKVPEAKVSTLKPAEKTALQKEVKVPEVVKQTEPLPKMAPTAQKKYLLSELDQARKAPAFQTLAEAKRASNPELVAQIQKLEKDLSQSAFNKGPIQQQINDLEKQLAAAVPKVVIEIPGDGTFVIHNTAESLESFAKIAAKFPTTTPRQNIVSKPPGNPKAVAALGKKTDAPTIVKALGNVVSDDASREVLHHIYTDGKNTVATNGRMLLVLEGGFPGVKKPSLIDKRGKVIPAEKYKETEGVDYPNYRQVMPKDGEHTKLADLNTDRMLHLLNQAKAIAVGVDAHGEHQVNLLWNRDGSIGIESRVVVDKGRNREGGEYLHNVQEGAKLIGVYDVKLLEGLLTAMRQMGAEDVSLSVAMQNVAQSSVLFGMPKGKGVLMPMRGWNDHEVLTAEDVGGGKPTGSKKPKIAKPNLFGGQAGNVIAPESKLPSVGSGVVFQDKGSPYVDVPLTAADEIPVAQMPAIVRLARELGGGKLPVIKKLRSARGMFRHGPGGGEIVLDPRIAADPVAASKTLAHEIGHWVDWFPDATLKRGNVGGHLAALRKFLKSAIPLDPSQPTGKTPTAKERRDIAEDAAAKLRESVGRIVETVMVEEPVYRELAITPEDIKSLFGLRAREDLPELYKWFAGLNAPDKKAVVKAAMQGIVDARAAAFAKREQVGTQTVERTVERQGGPEPSRAELEKAMHDAILAEYRRRNLVSVPMLRDELIALSDWWKPFLDNAANLPASYINYRMKPEELYADMVSVLLMSPGEFQARAPLAWEAFFANLDARPVVKDKFFKLWEYLNQPEDVRLADNQKRAKDMFKSGAEQMERKIAEKQRWWTVEGMMDALRNGFDTIYWPAIKRERKMASAGNVSAKQQIVEWFFDSHPLADNDVHLWLNNLNERIRKPLAVAGVNETDLGEFLLWDRIANESYEVTKQVGREMVTESGGRSVLFNPQGHTPETARAQLEFMERSMGPDAWAAVKEAAADFRENFFELTKRMRDFGMISESSWDIIVQNKDHYAAFVPVEYADTFVTSAIRQQMGTLKDVTNPFISTVLKGITSIRAIERTRAKQMVAGMLKDGFPGEIKPAKTMWDGKRHKPVASRDPDESLMIVMEGGKGVGYYVPKEIGEMLDTMDHASLSAAMGPLDYAWRNIFYPLFITYNPLFQFVRNPIRDTRRTAVSLPPGVAPHRAATMRVINAKATRDFVDKGIISPEIAAALAGRAFAPPQGTWQATAGGMDDPFEVTLRKFGILPELPKSGIGQWPGLKQAAALFERIRIAGLIRETTPKLGTFRILTEELGWPVEEAAAFVRNHVGTPNYLKKGKWTRVSNTIFPFSNVWMKGWQAESRLALKGFGRDAQGKQRKSPASWWMRWLFTQGAWRVIQAAGKVGILGAGAKTLYDRVGDYWMTNYDVIPIGTMPGGSVDGKKTVFIPIPVDPVQRIFNGIAYHYVLAAMQTAMGQDVDLAQLGPRSISLGTSDMPGIHPLLKIGNGWLEFAQGQNPYDSFRGGHVLTQQQQDAGRRNPMASIEPMLSWSYKQTGLQTFASWNPKAGTTTEMVLGSLPVINGVVKVSDNGLVEAYQGEMQNERADRAAAALSMTPAVQRLRQEYNHLRMIGIERRTATQEERYYELSAWNRDIYEPFVEAMTSDPDANKRFLMRAADSESKPFVE